MKTFEIDKSASSTCVHLMGTKVKIDDNSVGATSCEPGSLNTVDGNGSTFLDPSAEYTAKLDFDHTPVTITGNEEGVP